MATQETLFGTLSADGNTSTILFTSRKDELSGFYVHLSGTFGGGTVSIQFMGADGQWHTFAGSGLTEASDKYFLCPNEKQIRLNLAGATGASIYYELNASGEGKFRV